MLNKIALLKLQHCGHVARGSARKVALWHYRGQRTGTYYGALGPYYGASMGAAAPGPTFLRVQSNKQTNKQTNRQTENHSLTQSVMQPVSQSVSLSVCLSVGAGKKPRFLKKVFRFLGFFRFYRFFWTKTEHDSTTQNTRERKTSHI